MDLAGPALSLGLASLSPGGLGLKSIPNCPQLLSTRALSCPRPEERPGQRVAGSQVRAGPTWGRGWLFCILGWERWALLGLLDARHCVCGPSAPPPLAQYRGRTGCAEVSQALRLRGARWNPGPQVPEGFEPPGDRDTEEQLQRLREERTCKVCLDRTVCVVFVPCGHLVCAECAPYLQQCPICRAPVRSCVRTFLS